MGGTQGGEHKEDTARPGEGFTPSYEQRHGGRGSGGPYRFSQLHHIRAYAGVPERGSIGIVYESLEGGPRELPP